MPFPEAPRSSFSLLPVGFGSDLVLPEQCPSLTPFTFDPNDTPEEEYSVKVALGYKSVEAKNSFYRDMALRLAGQIPNDHCGSGGDSEDDADDGDDGDDEDEGSTPSDDEDDDADDESSPEDLDSSSGGTSPGFSIMKHYWMVVIVGFGISSLTMMG